MADLDIKRYMDMSPRDKAEKDSAGRPTGWMLHDSPMPKIPTPITGTFDGDKKTGVTNVQKTGYDRNENKE